ncbi:hypothetical protein RND71_032042 [Anisodus tanguticus]|uniref:Uncharacterized protein n=1 Tax=Anisodus tanguticus TaxID=243964 RepID=A0AAE1REF3_9SOLA|nr:hypothetical protein RND71_032042 [Anisodus tanguticus]
MNGSNPWLKTLMYKEVIHEYKKNHHESESAQPSPELDIEMWCKVVGSQKGKTYALGPRNNFERLQSRLRGEGTSRQGKGIDGVQVTAMAQQIIKLNRQFAMAEGKRLYGERVMQESLKSLEVQVRSHIEYGCFGVPRSPSPHPDDDDKKPEDDGEYVDRTPDHEMP